MKAHRCLTALLFFASAIVEAAEPAWQADAKGLTDGLLCSLVLRVRIGERADLIASGGTLHVGWNNAGPCEIPLGTIGLPGRAKIAGVKRSGDWAGGKAIVSLEGGGQITIHASQLSPGIVVETSTDRLRLFAGEHDRTVSFDAGKMTLHGRIGGKLLLKSKVTPAYLAVPLRGGMQVFATGQRVLTQSWALAWWGKASHFAATGLPIAGRGFVRDAYQADLPLLLVFDTTPKAIEAASDGGLDLTFAQPGGRVAILPVHGARVLRAEGTQQWAPKLPRPVGGRCARLASFARQYPVSARQSFRYDPAKDEATFTETVSFLDVGPRGRRLAPLPPVAALAKQAGLSIATPAELTDLGVATAFGPILGVADSDRATWSIRGLGRYVAAQRVVDGRGEVPKQLAARLAIRLTRLLHGGGILAPWAYADNVPINASRGEYYFGEPGEVLHLLIELCPVAPPQHAANLAERIAQYRKAHPPETQALIPPTDGVRRGGYDLGPCQLTQRVIAERAERLCLFALYGLARYYTLTNTKPDEPTWNACRKILDDAFAEQAWATLYLLGHPNRLLSWQKRELAKSKRLGEFQTSPHWGGDRPAAVVNANRQFAGAIGAVRLARLAGDAAAEQRAWRLLARAAVLRYAMGKRAGWQYGAGLVALPPNADWFWKWRQRFPQSWGGDLETTEWSRPEHDVRQVVELAPDRVELAHWAGVVGNAWTQRCTAQLVAFRFMTPELALFLRDHLKGECAALVERIEWNHPVWYASFAEAILGWEHNMNHPSDAYQVFLARAQILGERPERLEGWVDVPWLERGDLFHLGKLAETLKTYRGVHWQAPAR